MSKFQDWLHENYPPSHVFHGDPILDPYGRTVNPNANTEIWNGNKKTQTGNNDLTQVHKQAPIAQTPGRLESIEKQLAEIQKMLGLILQSHNQQVQPTQIQPNLPMARRV